MIRDLVAALFTRELEADHLRAEQSHRQALWARIQTFVLTHLGDPELTPGTIATVHHISTSYLHRLFQQWGLTVAGWVRANVWNAAVAT